MRRRIVVLALAGCFILSPGPDASAIDDVRWLHRWDTPYAPFTVVAVGGDRVYTSSLDEYPHYPITRVRSFDPDGRFLWWRRLPRVEVSDAAADESGVVLVGTGGSDAVVTRVTRARRVAWERRIVGKVVVDCTAPCEGDGCYCPEMEQASGVAVTRHAVYVTGEAETRLPGQRSFGERDGFLAKFTKGGRRLWAVQFGTPRIDQPYDIVVGHRRILVVGETWGDRPGVTHFLRAFRPDGSTVWERRQGSRYFIDPAVALVGRTIVVGGSRPSDERGNQIVVSAYGLQGRSLWRRGIWGSADDDWVNDGATVAKMAVFVGGTEASFMGADAGQEVDVLLLAVRGNGDLAWFRQIADPAFSDASSIAGFGGELIVGGRAGGRFLGTRGDGAFVMRARAG